MLKILMLHHAPPVFIIFSPKFLLSHNLSVSIDLSPQQKACRLTVFQPIEVYSTVSGKAATDRAPQQLDWLMR